MRAGSGSAVGRDARLPPRYPLFCSPGGDRPTVRIAGLFVSGLWEYDYPVRVKTSITLPAELLVRLDRLDNNRSALLERAALEHLDRLQREEQDRRDVEIINRHAERLNREAIDTLEYQQVS